MQTAGLSARQSRFVGEYLIDGCGAQAAIRSGVARCGAHVWASRPLRIAQVAAALQARQSADATLLPISNNVSALQAPFIKCRCSLAQEGARIAVSLIGALQGDAMTDREILAAALRWHRAREIRLAAGTKSNKFKTEQKKLKGFGGSDVHLSRKVTAAKRVELAALRELAKVCSRVRGELRQVDDASEVLDVDVKLLTCLPTKPKP